ncbi:hypothetical protein [Lactiplantibacillus plantarum]|uniref:hypothetical protein n=1 Tax=Lactiplantibacillus plantarum TaxID=1590 RepID=UPI0007E2F812|nr:hypothetical protein [Lactiplantibacillus plantarum]ANJ12792.1 hypothetical protein A8704_01670 [Lactiplantibacillus plantarum]MCB7175679.1 hypothetical protein [Lactiplantibacillus plantarum]
MEQDKLATDELTNLPLDHNWYSKLANNFTIIQKALNDLDGAQARLNSDQDKINQDLKNIKDDNKIRDANVQSIVKILSDYDVPIAIVDGKVVDTTKEGE